MTVAEKAQAKSLELSKKEEKAVVVTGPNQAIANIIGLTAEDLNMPYVYIVRANAKHAKLSDGKTARAGEFYHSVKKTATDTMEVMIAFAKKGKATIEDQATKTEKEVDAWRTLMVETSNIYSPFVMTFKQMNFWYGFKDLLSMFMAEGIRNPQDVVIKMTTEEATTTTGFTNYTPKFEIVRKTTDEEKAVLQSTVERFSVSLDATIGEETIEERYDRKQDEQVDVDKVLEDLDKLEERKQ